MKANSLKMLLFFAIALIATGCKKDSSSPAPKTFSGCRLTGFSYINHEIVDS
jgi:hypothetical protein